MLYFLLDWLNRTVQFPGLGVFQYLTFRAVLAGVFSLLISILIGRRIIDYLKRKLIGEEIRDAGPEAHKKKKGTPTMGGVIILAAIFVPTLLWGDLTNVFVLLVLFATLWMGVIGFVDDYIKVFLKDKRGLKGKFKLAGQIVLGLIVGLVMILHPDFRGTRSKIKDSVLKPNAVLREVGFMEGDRLLMMGSEYYARPSTDQPNTPYATYLVERADVNTGLPRSVRIVVQQKNRQWVSEELFGNTSIAFVTKTNVPFFKNFEFNYADLAFWGADENSLSVKIIYILMVIFIVTAVSNGANITDGLDGLCAGTTAIIAAVLGVFAYVSGNIIFSRYLNVAYIPLGGEVFIFCAALIGACIGFLWYNAHPAQVFMGDTGSLALGSAVAVLAIMVKKELLLPLICGVYLIENLSVLIQVGYFKYTKRKYGEGRRIFRMAPLHHHFELQGIPEPKIVTRFWIAGVLLAILAFATLKLR